MEYKFEPGMREISGFGGGYEEACQNMLVAGLKWCDSNPDAKPVFSVYKGIIGLIEEDNQDAKDLSDVVCDVEPDCTGAMHHTVLSHIMWIRSHSWDKYVDFMKNNLE